MQIYNNARQMPDIYESLAVAKVKMQPLNSPTYDLSTAFIKGTIYPSLDKPFIGKGRCHK